jgi:tRNA C32,U32 (ribose-2'-O)-methylase TrmJ
MTAAAASSPSGNRTSDFLEELEQTLKQLDTLSGAAQKAVGSVVQALLQEGDLSAAETTQLNALLACLSRRGHARPALDPVARRGIERRARRSTTIPSLTIR